MSTKEPFPQWVQNAFGAVLGSAVLGLIIAVWNVGIGDARRDEQIKQLESNQQEFRRPGARYSASDGDRDRAVVHELRRELRTFKDKGSRASPQLKSIQRQLDKIVKAASDLDARVRVHEHRYGPPDYMTQQRGGGFPRHKPKP
jgi:hypothetical protein